MRLPIILLMGILPRFSKVKSGIPDLTFRERCTRHSQRWELAGDFAVGAKAGYEAFGALLLVIALLMPLSALGQSGSSADVFINTMPLPSNKDVFSEDTSEFKKAEEKRIKAITGAPPGGGNDLDFKAPVVSFDKEKNEIAGSGGVVIAGMGVESESAEGQLNLTTKDAKLKGDVSITQSNGTVKADDAEFNFEGETGRFGDAQFTLEQNGFEVDAEEAKKLSEMEYSFENATFSTCHCQEGESRPWWFSSDECNVTQEGYGHSWGTTVHLFQIPVFYTPYFGFPAKTERASGLLIPNVGYSRQDGVIARVPFFLVLDDSTDMTIAPFTESQTRTGSSLDFRKDFSRYNRLSGRYLFSDESARGDDLRGTNTSGIFNPTIPTTRQGGFYVQQWSTAPDADVKAGMVADVHLVSDSLFAREIEDPQIADRQARYTISSMVARSNLGEIGSAEVSGEYDQSFETDQSQQLQRLPEFRLDTLRSFRPFGFNPLGVKLVTKMGAQAIDFYRQSAFDGWRTNVGPSVAIPLRYKGYFNSAFSMGVNQTWYNLRDQYNPATNTDLASTGDRTMPNYGYALSTAVERVYELPPDNSLTYLTSLGSMNQARTLARVKHTIEPFVNYTYRPDIAQGQLPQFDSFDRITPTSLFTYGLSTSLLGRFVPRKGSGDAITELAPRPEDLPAFGFDQAPAEVGSEAEGGNMGAVTIDRGEIRELMSFGIKQNWDYDVAQSNDPLQQPFSDIGTSFGIYPTKNFSLITGSNISRYKHKLSSWNLLASLSDDRGDTVVVRTSYQDNSLSQVEGNAELVLTERWKTGYYARYDQMTQEFIEQMAVLRLTSSCDCWHFDIGLRETLNPDKESFLLRFTFGGLGDISQSTVLSRNDAAQGP